MRLKVAMMGFALALTQVPATGCQMLAGKQLSGSVGTVETFIGGDQHDGVINIREFGAVGDGTTNDAAAFARALDALPSTGGAILFPPGYNYYLDSSSPSDFELANKANITIFSYGQGARITLSKNTMLLAITNVTHFRMSGLHIFGSLQTDGFLGNEVQGRLTVTACTHCEVATNHWENATQAIFAYSSDNLKIHHNSFINTFNPIETAGGIGAINANTWITDNYFLANNIIPGTTSHDDQIATFSGPSGRFVISRNIIDMQGDHPKSCCHGILVDLNASQNGQEQNAQEVIIADNIIRNRLNTTALASIQGGAIEVRGRAPGIISDVIIQGNILHNNGGGIVVNGPASRISIIGNLIDTVPASSGGIGRGIQVQTDKVTTLNISQNIVHNVAYQGIYVRNAARAKIEGNIVTSPGNNGMEISELDMGAISGNQVYDSSGGGTNGARLSNMTDALVIGNTFSGNTGYGLLLAGTQTRIKIIGNSWFKNKAGNFSNGSSSTTVTLIGNDGP